MRPHDIVILLKIIAKGDEKWLNKDLAYELSISQSEISDSLNRSAMAGLIDYDKKRVSRTSFMEFIEYGLRYVFPVSPEGMVNGIYTAHSHPFMKQSFASDLAYVWPSQRGTVRGLAVEPLYRETVNVIEKDALLYQLLALIDVIRLGKVRERQTALAELKKIILHEPQSKR